MTAAILFERVQRDEEAQRPDEDDRFAEQDRLARLEKAQRAREDFELARQMRIQNERKAEGLCILCGERLSIVWRILGITKHKTCASFRE